MAQQRATAASGTTPDGDRGPAGYAERLAAPVWLWLAALGLAAALCAEVFGGADGYLAWLPYLVLLPATALALVWLGRLRVAVAAGKDADGELRVDDARLPVRYVAEVGVLDADGKRAALGPQAHPYAFVVHRPWIRGTVLVVLDDPADPTPYWLVSARHPDRLAAALRRAAGASRADRYPPPDQTPPEPPANG